MGPDTTREIPVMDGSATFYEVSDLKLYTTYTFSVSAITEADIGLTISSSSTTPQGGNVLCSSAVVTISPVAIYFSVVMR